MHKTDRILHGVALIVAIVGSIVLWIQGYRLFQIDATNAAPFLSKSNFYVLAVKLKTASLRNETGAPNWDVVEHSWRNDGKRCAQIR